MVEPPFTEFHFIDADGNRTDQLRELAGKRSDVFTYEGDCNEVLREKVFPRIQWKSYSRALCLLDPYNIDLSWSVVNEAGRLRTVDVFLNFMIMDINMNVARQELASVEQSQIARMNRSW